MTDSEKLEILRDAFSQACKFIREFPPSTLEPLLEDPNLLSCFCDTDSDLEGVNIQRYFLNKAAFKNLR